MIAARASSVLADLLVLIVTIAKTRPLQVAGAAANFTSKIAEILMRDGVLYFGVLLTTNLIGLGLIRFLDQYAYYALTPNPGPSYSQSIPETNDQTGSPPSATALRLSPSCCSFTSIMTARFILDLHEASGPFSEDDLYAIDVADPGTLSTTVFQDRGAALSYSQYTPDSLAGSPYMRGGGVCGSATASDC
ncbi:hypothetical protein C8Q78DRAFT_1073233 [Trametes maxima]|nr:hypothetical protein C8Q78DRAFT_1073233 [Trametes maxima]